VCNPRTTYISFSSHSFSVYVTLIFVIFLFSSSILIDLSAHRQSPEDETDSQGGHIHSKTVGVKWNREEGDADISSAKHRSDFVGKVKNEKTSRPSSSSSGSTGMRSVVSAPDFSELKMLHESAEKAGVGRKRAFQMVCFDLHFYGRKNPFFFMRNISFFYASQNS
jgi:hypothetical protein